MRDGGAREGEVENQKEIFEAQLPEPFLWSGKYDESPADFHKEKKLVSYGFKPNTSTLFAFLDNTGLSEDGTP